MAYLKTHITDRALTFFIENQNALLNYLEINSLIKEVSGINNFFDTQDEAFEVLKEIKISKSIVSETDRKEYGDFQTNKTLAFQIARYAFDKYDNIEFVLEPTCGKGNFLIACISQFKNLKKVVGVEIYKPYVWKTKFDIFTYYLVNPTDKKPEIDIIHGNAFEFNYSALAKATGNLNTLVIGNPPWVTNSELGSIDSKNLPVKSNFKKHNGLDAMTGKGNFDIGEYISYTMLKCFDRHNGLFIFLIKNSVVKNIIQDQKINHFHIGKIEKLNINSKKEFNVSVSACLFSAHLNSTPQYTCKDFDFYSRAFNSTFGWYNDKFVNSIDDYEKSCIIEGKSIFTWRSGIKHDCSKVMELKYVNGHFFNGLGEKVKIENDLIYGLLKSSDLKEDTITEYRISTIITQEKIGQNTEYIKEKYPLTYRYLNNHKEFFTKRKSSIYRGKPDFSIFGIGDYSFAKYKVAVSGLYKSTHFTLVSTSDKKPIMLDDTCYFIGFDSLKMAQIAHYLVNSVLVQKFLKSIIFSDSKRPINKDILMRINFKHAFENSDFEIAQKKIGDLKIEHWEAFGELVEERVPEQMTLF